MKKWAFYLFPVSLIIASLILAVYGPDILSKIIVAAMAVTLIVSFIFGINPVIQFIGGFQTAEKNIKEAQTQNPTMPWVAVSKMQDFFGQKWLDQRFDEYKEKIEVERKAGMVVSSIDDVINEDELSIKCWHSVVNQVPGTLTGLGLIGTFLGLITGIAGIQISNVDSTMASITNLFSGIQLAFYTSIAGVILSIVLNMVYKMYWNVLVNQMETFLSSFHRNVIPTVEEQTRYNNKKEMAEIIKRLKALPSEDEFSLSNSASGAGASVKTEASLMPQILDGMKKNEFVFFLQPRYNLSNRLVIGAEALARWQHKDMGLVSPAVFIPVLEKNGYITKLDQYIWNRIFRLLRHWIDAGIQPVPIAINLSKTDILALDIPEVMRSLMNKYKIPPRYVTLNITQAAYKEATEITHDVEERLQQMGFKVIVDGFDGDFFALRSGDYPTKADDYNLDLRSFEAIEQVMPIIGKARELQVSLSAEGIESMKDLSALRKAGIMEGQGFYLSFVM